MTNNETFKMPTFIFTGHNGDLPGPSTETFSLNGGELLKVTICNGTLSNVTVQRSTLSNSSINNCQLFNCVIIDSKIINSRLHETRVEGSTLDECVTTTSPLLFRKFPPEIRNAIFKEAVGFEQRKPDHWLTPSLLIALRADPELYREALRSYYEVNSYFLKGWDVFKPNSMSHKAVEGIQKLLIR